jgi:hypothetical protein
MFDTFGGLTRPGEHDYTTSYTPFYKMTNEMVVEEWSKNKVSDDINKWCYCSLEQVQARLNEFNYDSSKLHYVVGNVMNTLNDSANIPEKIAILRLDTDWYDTSKFELEKLYDKVVTGGIIVFDDYYHWAGQRKATDDFFSEKGLTYDFVQQDTVKTAAIIKK